MKKYLSQALYAITCLLLLSIFQACQSDFQDENGQTPTDSTNSSSEIYTFSPSELDQMTSQLAKQGITLPVDTSEAQERGAFVSDIFVKAIKVSCKTPSPKNDGTYVDISGVLLVPKHTILSNFTNYRIIVATPPTYTSNNEAPSNLFKKMSLINTNNSLKVNNWSYNILYFFALQAKAGYAVLIPDYLGFGDSYKQCVHPYLDSKPMVESVLNLIKSAKSTLSADGYRYKKEIIVTGYSLGGFMAASLTRKLETEYAESMPVNLLFTGGTPCNLKQIVDIVRSSETLAHSYFIPLAIWGFKNSSYPQIDLASILKEPYAYQLGQIFDGSKSVDNSYFSTKVEDVYTENFIENLDIDPNLAYMNDILNNNSVKPWKNKCDFVMTHGVSDVSVYYQNAKDFANQQNEAGGKVKFINTIGDHVAGSVPYYIAAATTFAFYR